MNNVYIKNNSTEIKTYTGQTIQIGAYHKIENKFIKWQNSSPLIADIALGDAVVAKDDSGSSDILDVAKAINHLKGFDSTILDDEGKQVVNSSPYAAKKSTTHKFYKRNHGVNKTIAGSTTDTIEFTVPYPQAKIAKMEIMGCALKDTVNVKFYDTAAGSYSGTPDAMLNQFGHDAEMPPSGQYDFKSEYDADVYLGMIIKVEYSNADTVAKYVGLNIVLDELKAI